MKYFTKHKLSIALAIFLITGCGNVETELNNKIDALKSKSESLDSLVNKEVDKVVTLDSLINTETQKIKKLDTLINKTSAQLDSMSKNGINIIKKLNN